ncbi:MAG: CehA/McbA family metallohydrolase [Verrucomicrobia bacterium]|nr:CehA/McbA family metallohydrolase [Verrucomicrobiota bacterium]
MFKRFLLNNGLVFALVIPCLAHNEHDLQPAIQASEIELTNAADGASKGPTIDLGTPAIHRIEYPCYVNIALVDAESGDPVAGVIRFFTEHGQRVVPQSLLPRSTGIRQEHYGIAAYRRLDSWSVLIERRKVLLPRMKLIVEAFQGHETRMTRMLIDLSNKDKADIKVPVKKFLPHEFDKFFSGNVHLHYKNVSRSTADQYTLEVPKADGLDVVFFSYLERKGSDKEYPSNRFTPEDLEYFTDKSGVLFGWGEEYRHDFPDLQYYGHGYGHVMLLNLKELILPASFGAGITGGGYDDGTLFEAIVQARKEGATTLWCHNRQGLEDIPNWVAGNLDAQIIFEGLSDNSYHDTFYRYLNIGLHVPFSTGTDWFLRDLALTYVKAPLPLTLDGWLEALRDGKSFITNGPMLNLTVNDKGLGETVSAKKKDTLRINGRGYARKDFQQMELVRNGKVIKTIPTQFKDGHYIATLDIDIQVDGPAWFALRIPPFTTTHYDRPEPGFPGFNEFGMPLFAHTSAVYIRVNNRDVFLEQAAESLIAEVAWDKQTLLEHSVFSNDLERQKVLKVYTQAIESLKEAIEKGKL